MTAHTILQLPTAARSAGVRASHAHRDEHGVPRNRLHFAPHEHLFFQGDQPTGVFQIISGTVILYKLMADGRRQIQDFSSDGDFLALTFADIHNLSAEALTDVEVDFIARASFDRALQDNAVFRRSIFTLIGDMLNASREQALLLGRKCAMERTATFLLFLDSRFADPATSFVDIRMSRCDMADYVGLTLETVSRMMNQLKRQGIIELPQSNRIRISDRKRLIAAAGEPTEEEYASVVGY
ncbi:helix-turn-helix domain-containing protein [Hyphomonas sp.]|uniref:helix-turn-helix domain-containing protein n=1 Tax=Hyphomonas sp. TaxID=87 RepID=UPI0030FBB4C5